jgi:hypothetical protein
VFGADHVTDARDITRSQKTSAAGTKEDSYFATSEVYLADEEEYWEEEDIDQYENDWWQEEEYQEYYEDEEAHYGSNDYEFDKQNFDDEEYQKNFETQSKWTKSHIRHIWVQDAKCGKLLFQEAPIQYPQWQIREVSEINEKDVQKENVKAKAKERDRALQVAKQDEQEHQKEKAKVQEESYHPADLPLQ